MSVDERARTVAVVGSGPAALMAADVLSAAGRPVIVFEKRRSAGRKLLVAGSSGLNITNSLPLAEFAGHYSGPPALWHRLLTNFGPRDWIAFIEKELGIPTFEGTSGRYFVEDMKASRMLQSWMRRLERQGVEFRFGHECVGVTSDASGVTLELAPSRETATFAAALFALGGGSWEPTEIPLRWPAVFKRHDVGFAEFRPANVGFEVAWSPAFLREAEGLPLKNIVLSSPRGRRQGEAMVTGYGLEGTPVYFVGQTGPATLDLKPDLDVARALAKLSAPRENLSPIRRIKRQLNLSPAAFALVFHHSPPGLLTGQELEPVARLLKAFPIRFGEPRPLAEAISSSGGLELGELDDELMLRKLPGVFAAGEMLDWDVPTGGFLIQGAVSQGFWAGKAVLRYLSKKPC